VLQDFLEMLDITLDEDCTSLLKRHLDYVIETNNTVRLTAITDRREAERLHIVDSLLALPELLTAPPGPLLDIGSGGGYPGIPLALVSGRATDLLDSVQKKARAVQAFLDAEQEEHSASMPEINSLGIRAEDLALERPAHYAVVVTRAVAALPSLVELAVPLLCMQGRLIALKGKRDSEEIKRGVKVADQVGMRLISEREYVLPGGDEQRTIVVFERVEESQVKLPRRSGRAQRKPLA